MLSFDVNFLTSTVREPSRSPDATSEEILSGFISSTVPSPPLLGSSEDSRSSLEEQSFGGNSTTGSGPLNSGGEEVDSPPSKTSAASGRSKAAAAKKNVVIGGKTTEKPGHSYIALISMAIFSSPEKKLVLGEIYRNIKDSYPYYGLCEDNAWKNSIRHNLSLNECFIKNGRADNGKGHYWSVHPACEEDFRRGDFRRRQARRRAKRCHQQPQQPQQPALQHYTYPAVTGGYVQMTQMPTGIGGSSYRTSSASYHPYLPAVSHSSYLSAGHQSPSMPSPAYLTPGSSPPMPSPAYLTPGQSPPMPSSAYLTPGQSPPIPAPAYLSPGQGSTMTSPAYLGAGQSSPIPSPATSSYGGQLAYPSSYAASQYSSYPVPKPYTSTAPAGPPPNVTACQMGDFYSRGTGSIPSVTTSSQGQALTPLSTDFANIPSLSSYGLYSGPY